jgi:lipopolysaccharide export system protein LptC
MTGAPAHRARRDWSARARGTAIEALRYTRFVTVAKRATTLGAIAIIGAVLIFFFIQRQPRQLSLTYEKMGTVQDDLAMIKPRLTGADAKGNPFVITADAAIQDAHDPKKATLRKIEADLAIDKTSWIDASAARGMVDMTNHRLELAGGLDLFTDTGYQLHTESASVDLKSNLVTGPHEVTGVGPLGNLRADRFHANRQTRQILLEGNVRMTIDRNKT